MKVVINTCYGGFGLSRQAYEWLIEKKGWTITEYTKDGFGYVDPAARLVRSDSTFSRAEISYYLIQSESETEFRSSPDIIECVETLGKAADDTFAELKVIEIPDDIGNNWEIGEYDGTEWVQECHRRWS